MDGLAGYTSSSSEDGENMQKNTPQKVQTCQILSVMLINVYRVIVLLRKCQVYSEIVGI
jgi:hypothetical protein